MQAFENPAHIDPVVDLDGWLAGLLQEAGGC